MQKRKKDASTAASHSRFSQKKETTSKKESNGLFLLGLFSFVTAFVGIFVKLINGMDVYQIIFIRASLALAFIFFITKTKGKISELRIEKPLLTLFIGIFEGISILAFFLAINLSSVTNAIFLAYSAPIWSVFFSYFFLGEKIEKKTIISVIIAIIGILFIVDPRKLEFNLQLGNIFALLSGFFYAAMAILAKPMLEKKSGYYVAFWQYFVISVIFGIISRFNLAGAFDNVPALIGLGIFATGLSAILFMEGIRKVKGQEIFVITSIEPVFASILAFIILGEKISVLGYLGAALILIGIYNISKKQV